MNLDEATSCTVCKIGGKAGIVNTATKIPLYTQHRISTPIHQHISHTLAHHSFLSPAPIPWATSPAAT